MTKSLMNLLKIGEYEDPLQLRVKQRIEFACKQCSKVYITSPGNERRKEYPWLCRSCRSKIHWQSDEYRLAIMSGITDDLRKLRQEQRRASSIKMWSDPDKRDKVTQKLRDRDPSVYSRGKKKMRTSFCFLHWKTGQEVVCVGSYEKAFVEWCNQHQIDFEWQIPHKMPDGRTYIVDAFIKTGKFANTWIEVKGYMYKTAQEKWNWFTSVHKNAQLWTKPILKDLGIL